MAGPRVSIRLGTEGKAKVEQDFADVAAAGTAQAQRYKSAWERASTDAERALERQAKAAQRMMAAGAINPTTGAGYDQKAKSAAASASLFTRELERQEAEARRLLAAIDPLFAAQQRHATQVRNLNSLKAQGVLTEQRYQQLLVHEETLLNQATAAQLRHGRSSGQMRMGMQQLGFQLGDISQGLAMGTRASVIFAQQSGHVVQAMQLMGGEGNKFLKFIGGPWGIILSVGAVALTPLISKLFETKDATGKLVEDMRKQVKQAADQRDANTLWARSSEGVTEALREQRDALKEIEDQGRTAIEVKLREAQANLANSRAVREETLARLDNAKAMVAAQRARATGPTQAADIAAMGLPGMEAQLNTLREQAIADIRNNIEAAEAAEKLIALRIAELAGEDPVDKIRRKYKKLVDDATARATAENKVGDALFRQVEALRAQERAEVEAEQKRNRKTREPNIARAGGDAIQAAQLAAFFDKAASYRGKSETADRGVLKQFFTEALGKSVDPKITAWCAAFVNAVLASEGVKGTGSLRAGSFLGFGKDATNSPQKGDIVIVRSGGSPSGQHVGFFESIDAKGNVRVLGGNTGNRVASSTFAAKDVLGIRRPATAGESMASAEQASRELAEAASKRATEQFLEGIKASTKHQLEMVSKPFDERMAAMKQVKELNDTHRERMTLLDAELALAGESSLVAERKLRLVQLELQLRREMPGALESEIQAILKGVEAEELMIAKIEQVRSSVEEFREIGSNALDQVFNLDNLRDFGDLAKRVLDDIAQDFVRLALLNPLKNMLFGGNLPTLFGAFSGLGGGSSASGFFGGGEPMRFSTGTHNAPGGLAWVGEFGKELVRLPRGSKVTPAHESRRLAAANDGGIGTVKVTNYNDFRGADPSAVAAINSRVDQMEQSLPGQIITTVEDARGRFMMRG